MCSFFLYRVGSNQNVKKVPILYFVDLMTYYFETFNIVCTFYENAEWRQRIYLGRVWMTALNKFSEMDVQREMDSLV